MNWFGRRQARRTRGGAKDRLLLALARSFSPRLQSHPRVILRASAPRAWVCDLAQGGEVGLVQQGVEWQLELQVSGEGERVFGGFA